MNRIDELFLRKKNSVLSIYFTAGYPELSDTASVLAGLERAGADLVEIGFPFSDPVADGPVIQASSHQALQNGMNLDILFDQLRDIKGTGSIPRILMGYFNTVYQYGVEHFINQCVGTGIDGVIIPDLPPEIYDREYRKQFESAEIHFICLSAPQTSPDREAYLGSVTRGFLYRLSMSSTTGSSVKADLRFRHSDTGLADPSAQGMPALIGFGIHDQETFEMACRHANGAIIGTGFIRYLNERLGLTKKGGEPSPERDREIYEICREFINQIRGIS